jgi:hypothetical protein
MWAEVKNVMRARVVSGLFLLIALASPAFAADRQGEGRPSFDRILPEIRRHTPGTFYDAEGPFTGQDGQARYRIKWMTPEGRIVWFEVDAQRGHILGMVTGTLPAPSGRRDRFDGSRYDDDRYGADRYDGGRYDGNRRGDDRTDDRSNRFRNWPDYDWGQGGRGSRDGGRDGAREGRGGDGGWYRGGSGSGNSGRGGSRRGRGGRN